MKIPTKEDALEWLAGKILWPLVEDLKGLGDPRMSPDEKIDRAAEILLPYLGFLTGYVGRNYGVPYGCEAAHKQLMALNRADCERLSARIRGLSKEEIERFLTDRLGKGTTPENALHFAKGTKKALERIPENVHVSGAKAVEDALSPGLKKAFLDVMKYDASLPVPQRIAQWRAQTRGMTDEALAGAALEASRNTRADVIAQALYDMAQKCTADRLEIALNNLRQDLTGKELAAFANSLFAFTEEFLSAAQKKKLGSIADSKKGDQFAASARNVMTAFENAVLAAGLVPDKDPIAAYRAAGARKPGGPAA